MAVLVVIEPAIGSLASERDDNVPDGESLKLEGHENGTRKVSLGDVQLGVRCSRDRVTKVRAEGVQDALAVLDSHLKKRGSDQ